MAIILVVDIDGTLTKEICWTEEEVQNATPNQEMIDRLGKLYNQYYIIISTARRVELATATIKWLYRHDVPFHAISFKKTVGDLYVDDLCIPIDEFLNADLSKRLYGREPYP